MRETIRKGLADKLAQIRDLQQRQRDNWQQTATYRILAGGLLELVALLLKEEPLREHYKVIESWRPKELEEALNQISQPFTVVGQVHIPATRVDSRGSVLTTIRTDDTPAVD